MPTASLGLQLMVLLPNVVGNFAKPAASIASIASQSAHHSSS